MIYLLEDDDSIRNFVLYTLKNTGMDAEGFEKPTEFWAAIDKRLPRLILLDIMLPEQDGLEILKRLRTRGKQGGYR
jgi:two-component system alkaline phosphatase synthesis response regulator PhoP